jgi:hypothetical protein
LPQRGQYVVGSNRQSDVPDDHREYGTPADRFRLRVHPYDGFARVEAAQAGLRSPLNLHAVSGPEGLAGRSYDPRIHFGELDPPPTRL